MSGSFSPEELPPKITSTAEFARYVGLARTTVSRVLNGQPGVRPANVERIQRALAATGFTPNAYAGLLKGKSTSTVGLCMQSFLTPPLLLKMAKLQARLRAFGFASLIEVAEPEETQRVIRHFLSMRVDGVVFIGHFPPAELSERIHELLAGRTPHVVLGPSDIDRAVSVTLDAAQGMYEVVKHLLDHGHSTFALLGVPEIASMPFERVRGILRALQERGIDPERALCRGDGSLERSGDFGYGQALARRFLVNPRNPTAYLALNDEIAAGAVRALQEEGVSVPVDISVTGFNNQDLALAVNPSLTTVDQQIEPTVHAAAELLISHIRHGLPLQRTVLAIPPKLLIRQSTGPIGKWQSTRAQKRETMSA